MQQTSGIYSRHNETVSKDVNNGVIILKLPTAAYYGVDEVGTAIWNRLASPGAGSDLVASVTSRFDVTQEEAERDVQTFLIELLEEGLIEPAGPTGAPSAAVTSIPGQHLSPYRPPLLERGLLRHAANNQMGFSPDGGHNTPSSPRLSS